METRASYFLVGLFVLTIIAGAFAFVVWLARLEKDDSVYYYIYFRGSVTGLSVGSAVRYRGVPVGNVTGIELDALNVELVEVTVALRPGTPIKTDTIASLQLQGITGLSFVQLTGGTREAPLLEPRPGKRRAVIASRPSAIEQVFDDAPELLARLLSAVDRINALLGPENQHRIAGVLENAVAFSGALAKAGGDIEALASDAAGTLKELRVAAASLNTLARDFQALSRELGGDAKVVLGEAQGALADTRKVIGGAGAGVTDLRDAARSFEKMARGLETLVEESRRPVRDFANTGLYDLTQLIGEARGLVAALSRLAYQIERDPARFFFGDQQRGYQPR